MFAGRRDKAADLFEGAHRERGGNDRHDQRVGDGDQREFSLALEPRLDAQVGALHRRLQGEDLDAAEPLLLSVGFGQRSIQVIDASMTVPGSGSGLTLILEPGLR